MNEVGYMEIRNGVPDIKACKARHQVRNMERGDDAMKTVCQWNLKWTTKMHEIYEFNIKDWKCLSNLNMQDEDPNSSLPESNQDKVEVLVKFFCRFFYGNF